MQNREKIAAFLQLARVPNLPTAVADVATGYLIACGTLERVPEKIGPFAALLVISGAIYTGGMILNDYFDADVDTHERPTRPIPSGKVSRREARNLGGLLLIIAVAIAFTVIPGEQTGIIATVLALMVFSYNAVLKKMFISVGQSGQPSKSGRVELGPLMLGACRGINIILGASIMTTVLTPSVLLAAMSVGVFIWGVSVMAKREVEEDMKGREFILPLLMTLLALVLLGYGWHRGTFAGGAFIVFSALFALVALASGIYVIRNPRSRSVIRNVKIQLRTLIVLDAALAAGVVGFPGAIIVLALLIPALALDRLFYAT